MPTALSLLHLFLSAANAIVAFSLLVYILTHTPRNSATLSFIMIAALVTAMWVGEAGHISVRSADPAVVDDAVFWLKIQSVGLALLPAAYLFFSDMLLRSTGSLSVLRRAVVVAAYALGAVWLALMLFSDLVIAGPALRVWGTAYRAGPLYPLFAAYAIALTLGSLVNFFRARYRCLTASLRRRMGYLCFSFVIPALGMITYLLAAYLSPSAPDPLQVLFVLCGSIAVSVMVVVLAYIVSYQGVLLPDRVVKQSLITYLLRGPFLGVAVTFLIITIPRLSDYFAVFSDRFLVFAVVFVIVVLQAVLDRLQPYVDRIISQDEEVVWLEELNQRLLTSADLSELLNNTIIAVCEVLRVPSGFILAPDRRTAEFTVQACVGPASKATAFLSMTDMGALAKTAQHGLGVADRRGDGLPAGGEGDGSNGNENNGSNGEQVLVQNGYWLFPLAGRGETPGGFLAAAKREGRPDLKAEEFEIVEVLVDRASIAVEDVQLQRSVLDTLRGVAPEIEQVQQWGSQLRYASPSTLAQLDADPLYTPEFHRAVRDALSHYWGGPKLTANPLLKLQVVRAALPENNNNPSQALRAVLRQAVESLRPADERDQMASEWILYNILRLRFLQGKRVKEIVQDLAMSESDFYRKERAAIREVARVLATMENVSAERQRQ